MKKKISHLFCKLIEWITLNHFTIYNRQLVSVSYVENLKYYIELSEYFRSICVEKEAQIENLMTENIKLDARNHVLVNQLESYETELNHKKLELSKTHSQLKNLQGRYNQIDKQYQALKALFNSEYGSRTQKELYRRMAVKNKFENRDNSLRNIIENVNSFNYN